MAKLDKLLLRIRNNPQGVAFDDIDKLLNAYGFLRRQPRSGSSHYVYSLRKHHITVPYKRPHVNAIYVKQVLAILDDLDVSTDDAID